MSRPWPKPKWKIWRSKFGFYGVIGPETNGYIDVYSKEDLIEILLPLVENFNETNLVGFDFWERVREIVQFVRENKVERG